MMSRDCISSSMRTWHLARQSPSSYSTGENPRLLYSGSRLRMSLSIPEPRAVGPTVQSSIASSLDSTPTPFSLLRTEVSLMNTSPVFLTSSSMSSTMEMIFCACSGVMSVLTPPILQKEMMTLPPVTDSNTSRMRSLILQQCMNRLSNPMPSARSPSHSRWLWTLDSSWKTILSTWALSGTSTFISPSTAPA